MELTGWLTKKQREIRLKRRNPNFNIITEVLGQIERGATMQDVAKQLNVDSTQLERQMAQLGYLYHPGGIRKLQ